MNEQLRQQIYNEKVALLQNVIGQSMIKDLVCVMVDYLTLLGTFDITDVNSVNNVDLLFCRT
jgi:hypothetical protein